MRIVYFSKTSDQGPSSRYRIYQFLPYLEKAGIQCSIRPLFGATYFTVLGFKNTALRNCAKVIYVLARFLKRIWDLAKIGKTEVVVIEGQLFPYCPAWVERVLSLLGKKLVLEFDDAIYLTPLHGRKIATLLRISTAAVVGNAFLCEFARRTASAVAVIPTVVDTERFAPLNRLKSAPPTKINGPIRIVWIGLAYNLPYLEIIAPAIRLVQQKIGARFRVISSRSPTLPGVEVEFKAWAYHTEVRDLQECQIGVMPLPDSEWARAKCGLKLLQYMAVEIPAVASPVGVNTEIVKSGWNGFLAGTIEEWCSSLLTLCQDERLRNRMGEAARRTVEDSYSLHVWGPRLAQQYKSILEQQASSKRVTNSMSQSLIEPL